MQRQLLRLRQAKERLVEEARAQSKGLPEMLLATDLRKVNYQTHVAQVRG